MRFLDDDPALSLAPDTDVRLLAELFNAGDAARRIFSEVHFHDPEDPHLTVGMGHFIERNLADLFARLRGDEETWAFILPHWSAVLSAKQWQAIAAETGIDGADASALDRALELVLCVGEPGSTCVKQRLVPWADRVGEAFNSDAHWFTAGWKAICRAAPVARHQLETWRTVVLEKGVKEAAKRLQTTRGGISCVISAASSGLGGTMYPAGATTAEVSNHDVHQRWSLTEVPSDARPETGIDADRLLADWRAVVAWQYYTLTKGRVRSRMTAIWKTYYEATWGPTPKTLEDAVKVPRHRGTPMDDRSFDFSIVILEP